MWCEKNLFTACHTSLKCFYFSDNKCFLCKYVLYFPLRTTVWYLESILMLILNYFHIMTVLLRPVKTLKPFLLHLIDLLRSAVILSVWLYPSDPICSVDPELFFSYLMYFIRSVCYSAAVCQGKTFTDVTNVIFIKSYYLHACKEILHVCRTLYSTNVFFSNDQNIIWNPPIQTLNSINSAQSSFFFTIFSHICL